MNRCMYIYVATFVCITVIIYTYKHIYKLTFNVCMHGTKLCILQKVHKQYNTKNTHIYFYHAFTVIHTHTRARVVHLL